MFLKTSLFDEEFFHTSPVKHCKGRNIKIHSLWPVLKQCEPAWRASCVTSNTSDPLTKRPGARPTVCSVCLPTEPTHASSHTSIQPPGGPHALEYDACRRAAPNPLSTLHELPHCNPTLTPSGWHYDPLVSGWGNWKLRAEYIFRSI